MTEPVRVKTLDGEVRLWPDGLELVFAGMGAAKEKKAATPVLLRLSDIASVDLQSPRGVRRGVLQVSPHGFSGDRPKPEKDPLSATVAIGKPYDAMVRLCRELAARGVDVVGLPDEADAAAPAEPVRPEVTRAPKQSPVFVQQPSMSSYQKVLTWQVRLLGFQLFLYGLGALIVLGAVLFVLIALVRA